MLVLNAGALTHEYTVTGEGNELTLATHVLSPFLLTRALRPLLEASAPSRVIVVASGGMYTEPLDVDALDPEPAAYDGTKTYARCKRAQVVLAEEWTRELLDTGITVNAMHPGWADTPGLRTALPGFSRVVGPLLRTPEEGADTIVWLAAAPDAADLSGLFFLDRRARAKHRLRRTRRPDEAREAARLWRLCTERTAPFTAGTGGSAAPGSGGAARTRSRPRDFVGCRYEISVQAAGAEAGAELVRCAWACERERHRPGQPAEAGSLRLEQGGVEARDDDERRPRRLGRAGERCDRRVRAEKEDPPGVRAQDEREREQGDVVHLAGCTGEKSKRACSAAPEPGKRKQPAADEVAREVLLADLDLAPLPAVADLLQDGQHHLAQRLLQAERSKALVEHRVSGGLVVAADRREQASGGVLEQTFGGPLVLECGTRGLRG